MLSDVFFACTPCGTCSLDLLPASCVVLAFIHVWPPYLVQGMLNSILYTCTICGITGHITVLLEDVLSHVCLMVDAFCGHLELQLLHCSVTSRQSILGDLSCLSLQCQ